MSKPNLRLVFAGTPEFAAVSLRALIAAGQVPVAVYSQPDRPAGRGRKLSASPVKQVALEHELPVLQPPNFKSPQTLAELKALNPDVLIVVAYGLILPQTVLDIATFGAINVHASLLPRWRGAAPIQRAILAGDNETGITTMQMDAGLDTGAILRQSPCPILAEDSAGRLHDRLARLGGETLLATLDDLTHGRLAPVAQDDSLASYARKITVTEAALDWRQAASELERRVRAFNPVPVAYAHVAGERYRIWQARALAAPSRAAAGTIVAMSKQGIDVATGDGVLRIELLQAAGRRPLSVADYVNGHPALAVAQCFSAEPCPAADGR